MGSKVRVWGLVFTCAVGGRMRPTDALRYDAGPEEGNSWMEPSVTPPASIPPSGEYAQLVT